MTPPKVPPKGSKFSTPGLKQSRIMAGRKLSAKSGTALVDVRGYLALLLHRYLSSPRRPGGPAETIIFLSSHLSFRARRHPSYCHLSRTQLHRIVVELVAEQFCLHLP